MHRNVLVYGNDAILLLTRRLLLEKAGFRVFTTLELSDAMQLVMHQDIALLVLCQSLRADERQGILATIRAIHPTTKILIMQSEQLVSVIEPHEEIVDTLEGPEGFLTTIHRMLDANVLSQTSPG
jgi:DNA-binding NtrC family response regulator